MCLFRLLTVANWRLHTGQLVAPVWIFVWFLSEPGVVNTLRDNVTLAKGRRRELHLFTLVTWKVLRDC